MSVCFEQVQVRQSVGGRGCHGESAFGFVCQVFKEALSQGLGGEPGNEGSKYYDKRKL